MNRTRPCARRLRGCLGGLLALEEPSPLATLPCHLRHMFGHRNGGSGTIDAELAVQKALAWQLATLTASRTVPSTTLIPSLTATWL